MAINTTIFETKSTSDGSGVQMRKIESKVKATYNLRFFPFNHTVQENEVAGRFGPEHKPGDISEELFCRIQKYWINAGKVPALGPVPAYDEEIAAVLASSKTKEDLAVLEVMKKKIWGPKYCAHVVFTGEDPNSLVWVEFSSGVFYGIMRVLTQKDGDGVLEYDNLLGNGGRDFILSVDPSAASNKDWYTTSLRDREKCDVLEIDQQPLDFYSMPSFAPGWNVPDKYKGGV